VATVKVYAITSLTFAQARPARLGDYLRGHWAIENGLHYLRDTAFAEDGSQVRTGAGPHVMACLRNLAIGGLCRAGPVNLAAALRRHARNLPASHHPRDHPQMNQTLRANAGGLGGNQSSLGQASTITERRTERLNDGASTLNAPTD